MFNIWYWDWENGCNSCVTVPTLILARNIWDMMEKQNYKLISTRP